MGFRVAKGIIVPDEVSELITEIKEDIKKIEEILLEKNLPNALQLLDKITEELSSDNVTKDSTEEVAEDSDLEEKLIMEGKKGRPSKKK